MQFISVLLFLIITFEISAQGNFGYYTLEHNKITFPFNSRGKISDVGGWTTGYPPPPSFNYEGIPIVFSAGFLLTGKNGDTSWINGVAGFSRIEDYMVGTYFNSSTDSLAQIFVLQKSDSPFSQSWQDWKYAVQLGANFYDGNENGIYDPIDLNLNNQWDKNEDRPDLIGEETAWCVYKDNVPSKIRRFEEQKSKGIEIQQTIFVTNKSEAFENTIFIRYKIINTGLVADIFDSVYFSVYADPDIGSTDGDYTKDLVGCDTILNAGFAYKNSESNDFGLNPPCLLIDLVNGPISYIPNVTYQDINSNNIYDAQDIPIDSAFNIKGKYLATQKYLGAKNLKMSSFINLNNSTVSPVDPEPIDIRYNMMGMTDGFYIDPCDWTFGKILNEDCKNIDGKYMYSGDPFYLKGWVNIDESDQRMMINTGPFQLRKDQPIEITVAYIVGQGDLPMEAVKIAKQYSRKVQFLFDNNLFETNSEPIVEPTELKLNYDFVLYQNYPNPFNPTTNIRYNLRNTGLTTLKVYDILGREILELVNEVQAEGVYVTDFDGSSLPSGIYFYQLNQGAFFSTKQMLILK